MRYIIYLSVFLLTLSACKQEVAQEKILDPAEYDPYLTSEAKPSLELAQAEVEYWSKRLRPDTSGVGDIAPLATAYEQLFAATGDPIHLKNAEQLFKKGIAISANDKDAFVRGLAHNYVSQHRFKEAYVLLKDSYEGVSNKKQTKLMLFDVAMEVGDYDDAYLYLNELANLGDYHYLIRISKWSDYKGNLDDAIRYMEEAKRIAESRDSKPLKIWTYSNLGDYYGHAGRIKDAYQHYLMTLALQPDNAYVKKGLAWIAYAWENDTPEAHRILDAVMKSHQSPDYHLLKAELFSWEGLNAKADLELNAFQKLVSNPSYGAMYNAHLIELYAENNSTESVKLAEQEVADRPTPEAYHLLAMALLNNGQKEEALKIIDSHVSGKTFEPMAQFHSAVVYKANGLTEKATELKEELLEASFELGPMLMEEIESI